MNFQPLKDFMDNYIPMLGVPGTDIVIYKDHEEIFRYQSGFDSITEGTPVRPDALYYMPERRDPAPTTRIQAQSPPTRKP